MSGTVPLTAEGMRATIQKYWDGCNEADVDKMASCFTPDGTHYFPPGMYAGPFRGGRVIGERWAEAVATLGSIWTIDQLVIDVENARAVLEWSHFKTFTGVVLRGDEWYEFDRETGLIRDIRAYYASPQDPTLERLELGGFDYEGRGYPVAPPFVRERPDEAGAGS